MGIGEKDNIFLEGLLWNRLGTWCTLYMCVCVYIYIYKQKSPKYSSWVQSQKQQNDLCSLLRQTIQYHSNPSLCPDQ